MRKILGDNTQKELDFLVNFVGIPTKFFVFN